MALWVLELNDIDVRISRDGEVIDSSPGIAVVKRRDILTGHDAAAEQHLNPRAVYNRYWQQLNEAPLPGATRQCRHHADLAYHHLAAILARAGQPTEVVIAVPAHYGESELALLLGICAALKLGVAALVDSNVAALAGSATPGRYTLAEIYQHHVTLVDVTVDSARGARRGTVRTLDQAGRARIEEAAIDLIADAFLEQARFDPLHEAATEQLLYSNLPDWISGASSSSELDIAIDYHGSRFSARIARREFERITAMVLEPLNDNLGRANTVVLSARLADLPGARSLLAPAAALAEDASVAGIAEHRLALASGDGAVVFVTELPATARPTLGTVTSAAVTRLEARSVSHILAGAHAVPLHRGATYLASDGTCGAAGDAGAAAHVQLEDGHALLYGDHGEVRINGAAVDLPSRLRPGDQIVIANGGAAFTAISVASSSAP